MKTWFPDSGTKSVPKFFDITCSYHLFKMGYRIIKFFCTSCRCSALSWTIAFYPSPFARANPALSKLTHKFLTDASTLAFYSSNFPNNGEGSRGQASGIYYMGPDYASQQGRIAGNLKRAWQFKTDSTSDSAYITTSCKDTKNLCNLQIDGKGVGGYAWTYDGWWAYYHYITLCPPFFSLDSLSDKLDEIEGDLASGSTTKASDMRYLKSTGQFFLHEMMHTRIADGGVEPHIIDEYVVPIPAGEKPGTKDRKAYGPGLVHNLARRNIKQGGGATRASTNADSYAILANAAWSVTHETFFFISRNNTLTLLLGGGTPLVTSPGYQGVQLQAQPPSTTATPSSRSPFTSTSTTARTRPQQISPAFSTTISKPLPTGPLASMSRARQPHHPLQQRRRSHQPLPRLQSSPATVLLPPNGWGETR